MHIGLNVQCRYCHKITTIVVDRAKYHNWLDGQLIQKALPELSAGERELLISETCGECFDKMFAEPENGENS